MSQPADRQRHRKLRQRNPDAAPAPDPCPICGGPWQWRHHVGGHANFPEVTECVCRRCADLLDAFLGQAGVKLKHGEPRTTGELVWAAIAGVDALRAARDGKAALSPTALAAVRLITTQSADVRGPRPAANDARHSKRSRQRTATASFEAARARAMHDLLAAFPAAERLPDLLELLDVLADPEVLERLGRIDSETIEPLHASHERATVELLDTWRAAETSDPGAQAAVALAERRFVQAVHNIAEHIQSALGTELPRESSA
jgi:hypothetical protein